MTAANPTPGEPATLEALFALAQREHRAGRLAEATAACGQILAIRPDLFELQNYLGVLLAQQGKLDEALARFEQALVLKPNYADAHNNAGSVLLSQGRLVQAAARYTQALALDPNNADAHNNLGSVLLHQGRLAEAAAHYTRALAIRPDHAEAHNNLGNALVEQGLLVEAAARFEQAVALRSDYAEAHNNLGSVLVSQGRLDEAAARYRQAIALRPDYAEPQLGLATCYLATGDYQRGWPANEARLRVTGFVPPAGIPRWTGEPLAGRSLLLVPEQGLGDAIQFLRYIRPLKELGARVVLACPKALGRLLASHSDVDELFILGSAAALPRVDFYLPLMSAPAALLATTSAIPADVPYLWADPRLTEHWRQELAGIAGLKIGIVWQGSREYRSDRWRSIPLARFAPLARLPGVRLISLQKGFGSEQVATVGFPVLDLSGQLDQVAGPFMDTAAVIGNLDLVVSPDTAIAHLAGALGAPVWLALQSSPDWRWMRDRDDSPWYPTARLFRQSRFGQWPDVFERMAKAIQTWRSDAAALPPTNAPATR
ncbi:MAG TPA: tetratricopeptide repeat protein [Pirellulales bacterium]|jgi:tetratricopeptide (TPR) repeat protein|nr:tetratricopeptide repeat protein [Pirellulales bacterium]